MPKLSVDAAISSIYEGNGVAKFGVVAGYALWGFPTEIDTDFAAS